MDRERRTLLKLGALGAGAALAKTAGATGMVRDGGAVRRVLLVAKCHLDVGFTQTQKKVMERYFQVYYPQAIRTAAELRERGGDRYVWTTGSWLLYEYLEQAGPTERAAMEKAVAAGDIAWHALPFSWQSEMMTSTLIAGALGFSAALDQRFGRKTIAAKMTDVPGHTRGLVAPLHAAGVRMLNIGINAASTPPDVPELFVWKDSGGGSLAMMYHRHDYGGIVLVPGSDVAVDVEVRNDNSGPHTLEEIAAIYTKLRTQFPEATVTACTLNEVAQAVDAVRDRLPVVQSEIGDTWIYGVASDPLKVARFRESTRLRERWIEQGRVGVGDAVDRQFLRRFLLEFEHTWGTDTKSFLDNEHYRPKDLAKVLGEPGYRTMEYSWEEKRDDLFTAVSGLPDALRKEMDGQIQGLAPVRPKRDTMQVHDVAGVIETRHFRVSFDAGTGAMVRLQDRATKREWASADHPLALFTYQTLSSEDFARFLDRYIKTKADWAPRDFGKPGIDVLGAVSREWHPRLVSCWVEHGDGEDRVLLEWRIEDEAAEKTGNVAWPKELFCDLRFPVDVPRIDLTVSMFGKAANRLPEAIWLSFAPQSEERGMWSVRKIDEEVDLDDVVRGGGRSMHAILDRIQYRGPARERFEVKTLDAPLVAVSGRSPLNFSLEQPDLRGGVHFGLYNNAWGTNYVQWAGGDWQFRFSILTA